VKHKLKMAVREMLARVLYHTGLHALVDRLAPRRLVILAGHCVAPESGDYPAGRHLPADMVISAGKLRGMLEWFARRYGVVTIGAGVEALDRGLERSLVAFSFDDGYRDNHDVLLPLLRETRTTATVFLESRPLDERRVSWTHKLFWLLSRMSLEELVAAWQRFPLDMQLAVDLTLVGLALAAGMRVYRVRQARLHDRQHVECRACGHDLTGTPVDRGVGRCPECGAGFARIV